MQPLTRSLAEGIQVRVLVGISTFVGIMVLVGWVAINEPARMAAFTEKYEARSIERGAELFAANCTSCHGIDGRGLTAVGPALNSPHFFGYDFLREVRSERSNLEIELESEGITEERIAEIDARLAELQTEEDAIRSQMTAAINAGYDPDEPSRLAQVGWGGTEASYVETTLIHGRPNSAAYWPQAMVSWSQLAGGPLRGDQIGDLTAYILNWDKGDQWTMEDLNAVLQYSRVPVDGATVSAASADDDSGLVGTDVAAILVELENWEGNPQEGQTLYTAYACAGCHAGGIAAPDTEGQWTRFNEVRLADPLLEGYTAEQYAVESIVAPNAYISPNYGANLMPQNFGEQITNQEMAHLLAYIASQDQAME